MFTGIKELGYAWRLMRMISWRDSLSLSFTHLEALLRLRGSALRIADDTPNQA
jgi:hypothetical protein